MLPLLAAVLVGCATFVAYQAVLVTPRQLALRRANVTIRDLRERQRILLVSDLHLRPARCEPALRRLARVLADLERSGETPEVIAYTGDLLEIDSEAGFIARAIARATSPYVEPGQQLVTIGNHEQEGCVDEVPFPRGSLRKPLRMQRNDVAVVVRAFGDAGLRVLDDEAVTRGPLRYLGLTYRDGLGPAERALRELARPSVEPTIALTHSPDQIVGLAPGAAALALCGHTHGGQVRLPIVGALTTATHTSLRSPDGLMIVDATPAYVSAGAGQSVPLRLGTTPEVVLLTLDPA